MGRPGRAPRHAQSHIPSWVLQGHAPLQAYPEAAHSGRSYRPEWEAEMLDLDRVFEYLTRCLAGFGACGPTGGSTLVAMTTIWAPAFRSHLLSPPLRCQSRLLPGATSRQ